MEEWPLRDEREREWRNGRSERDEREREWRNDVPRRGRTGVKECPPRDERERTAVGCYRDGDLRGTSPRRVEEGGNEAPVTTCPRSDSSPGLPASHRSGTEVVQGSTGVASETSEVEERQVRRPTRHSATRGDGLQTRGVPRAVHSNPKKTDPNGLVLSVKSIRLLKESHFNFLSLLLLPHL